MATLWVGASEAYKSLSSAVAAAGSGDTIYVRAGTYTNDFVTLAKDVTIVGVGGKAHFTATVAPGNGKALFVTRANVTLDNLEFSGARVPDGNGAGIRYEAGHLVVKNSAFHHNENGLLAAANGTGTLTITGSHFAYNGKGDGYTHNLYVNQVAKLTVADSHFHDVQVGHHIKSRAAETVVVNSKLIDGAAKASYAIDLPNGGAGLIRGNHIEQGAGALNKVLVSYGAEGNLHAGSRLTVEANHLVNKAADAVGINNWTGVSVTVQTNGFTNVPTWVKGPAVQSGNVSGPPPTANTAPDARDDAAATAHQSAVKIAVLANDHDADGDSLAVAAVTQGQNGTVKINADGTLTYTPKTGFAGQDSFTYTVKDAHGATDTATVKVSVEPAPTTSGTTSGSEPTSSTQTTPSTDRLTVRVSGDDFRGDPEFRLLIDGAPVSQAIKVSARHDQGQWQDFTFSGTGLASARTVGVEFLNDAWGGSSKKDRNLWVDRIEVNGKRLEAENATYKTGDKSLPGTELMSYEGTLEFDLGMIG